MFLNDPSIWATVVMVVWYGIGYVIRYRMSNEIHELLVQHCQSQYKKNTKK